jgi:hypothetical protein
VSLEITEADSQEALASDFKIGSKAHRRSWLTWKTRFRFVVHHVKVASTWGDGFVTSLDYYQSATPGQTRSRNINGPTDKTEHGLTKTSSQATQPRQRYHVK